MWFWASIVIAVASGLTHPFLTRLHATGLWAGKAITPAPLADQLPTGLQDALTHGWISGTVFLGNIFQLSEILMGDRCRCGDPTRVHAQRARTGALSTPPSPRAATSPSSADHLFRRIVCARTRIPTRSIVSR